MKKRIIGIALIIIGIFITIAGKSITGNVIGFQPENYINWLGIIMAVLGITLLIGGDKLESQYNVEIPQSIEGTSARDLINSANEILRGAGLGIWGNKPNYQQSKFERKMKTGAYSSQSGKHK